MIVRWLRKEGGKLSAIKTRASQFIFSMPCYIPRQNIAINHPSSNEWAESKIEREWTIVLEKTWSPRVSRETDGRSTVHVFSQWLILILILSTPQDPPYFNIAFFLNKIHDIKIQCRSFFSIALCVRHEHCIFVTSSICRFFYSQWTCNYRSKLRRISLGIQQILICFKSL